MANPQNTGPLIPEGYILLSRKILNSGIFNKPHLYIKVWIYLLTKAQYKDYKDLKRGQLWTSIPEIQEACSYTVGYRKETPSYKQVRDVIEWLRSESNGAYEGSYDGQTKVTMIGTTKGTHGLLVTIHNYSVYQDSKNYEGQDEGQDERIAKEKARAEYKQECKRMNNIYNDHFDAFWNAYPRKVAKAAAQKAFNKLKVNDEVLVLMISALDKQKQSKQWQDKQFVPHATTWLAQRRWEDEESEQEHTNLNRTADGTFKF